MMDLGERDDVLKRKREKERSLSSPISLISVS
jgi:hypothetical protein